MSLKNYIFSSINTKGAQDSGKFATIRFTSSKKREMMAKNGDNTTVAEPNPPANDNATPTNANVTGNVIMKHLVIIF